MAHAAAVLDYVRSAMSADPPPSAKVLLKKMQKEVCPTIVSTQNIPTKEEVNFCLTLKLPLTPVSNLVLS